MTKRFHNIFLLTILLFIAHGIEEYLTDFYLVDRSFLLTLGKIGPPKVIFIIYQLVFWLLLTLLWLKLRRGKTPTLLLAFVGLLLLLELQHWYESLSGAHYYPGFITALFFPVLSFFYWKELITSLKRESSSLPNTEDLDEFEDYVELQDPLIQQHIEKSTQEFHAGKGRLARQLLSTVQRRKEKPIED